ncbi:carboxy terminal-processing peptidase [Solitalea koreensis]|uniref:Carboxyl-terminal processing protease n=1 Tax=Solitalea koreensis TaxID=543615 RepID=A0A521BSW3_9SPHI|nr:carboxy terminal-processing peptidase [Solitalea koreensis]SMO49640.1 carboxyl-terminal processing protease [Solitalea koreensis]
MKFRFISPFLIAGVAGSLMAFDTPNEKPQDEKLIVSIVGKMIKVMHYDPQKIDDNFSKKLFWNYLEKLDGERKFFLQTDIDYLKKYELEVDDEIIGNKPLGFLNETDSIFDIRMAQSKQIYLKVIGKKFTFNNNDSIQLDYSKVNYAASAADIAKKWKQSLKYSTLIKISELMDSRKKAKADDPIAKETDTELQAKAIAKVKKKYDKYFVNLNNNLNEKARFEIFANTITTTMDPHSAYMSPISQRGWNEGMSGTYCGVGLLLKQEEDYVKVDGVVPGGPAWKQGGLKAGDVILRVGSKEQEMIDVADFSINEIIKLTRGVKGSTAIFTVKQLDGTIKTVSLIRDELKQEGTFAHSYIINGAHKIGMIVLPEFYINTKNPNGPGSSAYDVAQEVEKLKAEKVEGIVIDLRSNGGGSLKDVVNIAGLFIPEGPVVQVRSRDGKVQVLSDTNPDVAYDGPLAIMVNEGSASASEILAAAMQDYKRAIIIGSPSTYGKGTVQRMFDVNRFLPQLQDKDLGAVKLTIQKFYRINGSSTQQKGVTPDIIIKDQFFDVAEKNEPSVLNWDEITSSTYSTWNKPLNLDVIRKNSAKRIAVDSAFNLMEQKISLLKKQKDNKVFSLNLQAFKSKREADFKEWDKVNKLKDEKPFLDVLNLKTDEAKLINNKISADRNEQLLKIYKIDHYLGETVQVMNEMINANTQIGLKN